ncbi:DUF427 domain-containing protein [Arthrobacter sp. Hz1]
MARALWNGAVIAESEDGVVVEGNSYFPMDAVDKRYFKDSDMYSVCPWKGKASYRTLEVDGRQNTDAAWFYPEPSSGRCRSRTVSPSGVASPSNPASRHLSDADSGYSPGPSCPSA